jgi:outer membrane protein insertion porin family
MKVFRALGLVACTLCMTILGMASTDDVPKNGGDKVKPTAAVAQQRLVESVDIQGNRRQRDDDLLYYIKTRPGDVYDSAQLERDLKELLALNFFDKAETKVLVEDGVRGGVNVIFMVKELPIIRDLQFEGIKAVQESDILKEFRENRAGISKEAIYDPVKVRNATRILREMLASKGFPNAKIDIKEEEVSATSVAITFVVDQGERSRIIEIDFEGNEHFKDGELRGQLQLVKESGLFSRFKGQDILDTRKLQYDLNKNVREYMFSKGYFQARVGEPEIIGLGHRRTGFFLPVPFLSSKDDALKIVVPITEGKVFRVGDLKVEGNSIFTSEQLLSYVGLKKGEIADGKRLRVALYEDLKKIYGSQGFILYDAETETDFKDDPANAEEGIVDITIKIDEGKQFSLRRIEFAGNTFTRDNVLRREMILNEGDIYNQLMLETSVIRLNQTQYFDPIDKDKDVEVRTDEETGQVDMLIRVKEKGRQQISFNGGVSGIGGSFFGFEYSTNNLFGRGEVFSLTGGFGNRQTYTQLSFTEPYFKDRPISVGFSAFAYSQKFFGEGTLLSGNLQALVDATNPFGTVTADESNLFTRNSYGGSIFATAPLSELFFKKRRFTQFTRIGLTYQLSASTIKDPPVNSSGDAQSVIPVIFRQPNITTSRVTPTFVYDSRQPASNGIDTLKGMQLAASLAFSGLGGDVRTYQPSISWTEFIPIRKKRSKNPEVFGFRIVAGTIGSFATSSKVRDSNSLAFVDGVPIFERYFLGSEQDLRGYDVRSISPVVPVNTYLTTRNVVAALNQSGTPVPVPGLNTRDAAELAAFGTFTGFTGSNPALISRSFNYIGGDTQLLGNFEYRIPIFGPASMAFFADIGSVFNIRKGSTQIINSEFLPDQPFLGAFNDLSLTFLRNNLQYQPASPFFGGLVLGREPRPLTREEFNSILGAGAQIDPRTGLPLGLQPVFLRGDAQTNQLIEVNNSQFAGLKDYRSSVGVELRVQVPIVNVPFRLIYYINPNAKNGFYENLPNFLFNEKKRGFRFTVGRTF